MTEAFPKGTGPQRYRELLGVDLNSDVDKSNMNNILFMLRFLHQGFDDIALRFRNFHPTAIICPVGGGRQMEFYEVSVRVVFLSEYQREYLTPFFKDSTRVEGLEEIELNLYVKDHQEFKEFTLLKWASLASPVG